ncbi:Uncharacterised protein [Mycobacteroides abscessus subsp. abscessus]|nr:Uncharacterised protein [Mycobacteroides abscessus subsp. abscessus]
MLGLLQISEGFDLLAIEEEQSRDPARDERFHMFVPRGCQRIVILAVDPHEHKLS